MICREWQRKIPDFLNNSMQLEEQQRFIAHVRECKDCYEELEIMYMLAEGLKELENEGESSFNFKNMLDRKLRLAQAQCERHRSYVQLKVLILCTMYTLTAIGAVIQIFEWI